MMKKIALLALATLVPSMPTFAAFEGDYAPDNWSVTEPGPLDPSEVDVIGEFSFPDMSMLIISSPDCINEGGGEGSVSEVSCSGESPYIMAIEVVATGDAFIEIDWTFETDDGPFYDSLGVWRDGLFDYLIDTDGASIQSGSAGFNVIGGTSFGFGLVSEDSCCGASYSEIFGFSVGAAGQEEYGLNPSPVPLPASIWLLGSALTGLATIGRRRKQRLSS